MLSASTGRDVLEPEAAIMPITIDGTDVENISLV
jgi:hypothetical protein